MQLVFKGSSKEFRSFLDGMCLFMHNHPDTDCNSELELDGWWAALHYEAKVNSLAPHKESLDFEAITTEFKKSGVWPGVEVNPVDVDGYETEGLI